MRCFMYLSTSIYISIFKYLDKIFEFGFKTNIWIQHSDRERERERERVRARELERESQRE